MNQNLEEIEIKLSDFRMSHLYVNQVLHTKHYKNLDIYYQAPEIIKKEAYDSKIDVWSACIVIYILLTGDRPLYGK